MTKEDSSGNWRRYEDFHRDLANSERYHREYRDWENNLLYGSDPVGEPPTLSPYADIDYSMPKDQSRTQRDLIRARKRAKEQQVIEAVTKPFKIVGIGLGYTLFAFLAFIFGTIALGIFGTILWALGGVPAIIVGFVLAAVICGYLWWRRTW